MPSVQASIAIMAAVAAVSRLGSPPLAIEESMVVSTYLAFGNSSGKYLGSTTLSQYSDIRIFTRYQGVLYVGVQNHDGSGSVLRWTGMHRIRSTL